MKRIFERTSGECLLTIGEESGHFTGIVWKDRKREFDCEGTDFEKVKAALINHAGKLHPDYFGIEGAKKRFHQFFPHGFDDKEYLARERNYKVQAREQLLESASLSEAIRATSSIAQGCKKGTRTNLLSRFEAARLNELLDSENGPVFIKAAAEFTQNPTQDSLLAMAKALAPHGRPSWPLVTYFPYLWNPDEHMFLKPNATVDFALRTGHQFAAEYDPDLDIGVYEALMRFTAETAAQLTELNPKDRIDVQSFIWVVGSYEIDEISISRGGD